ncbi:MAG: SMP-30/gluconolactonase/LRE family protein [Marinibacterium sp.]|nr:SMP-30/gluconolactonase/LRE family protein [Marinibacterium sp.]
MTVFDTRRCDLGEGPLWHPLRNQLFWFDIPNGRMLSRDASGPLSWDFDEPASAAGWVDHDTLLTATASGLWRFDLRSGARDRIVALEADNPVTRSNDGRADPWGGFWIGTMGRDHEADAGAIYRYWRGELRQLYAPITIPNAICFAHDQSLGYFTDTLTGTVMRQRLDPETGWPDGLPDPWLDLRAERLNPDGAVVDASGNIWIAQWGAWRVACYDPDGTFLRAVEVPAKQASCPAFGGADLSTLYVTSAAVGLRPDRLRAEPDHGRTFAIDGIGPGRPEYQVIL